MASETSGLSAALTLFDQGQNGSDCVSKFGDPANDGRRGQPKLACRVLDQGVLRLRETVEQRSEVGRGVAHSAMLGQTALTFSEGTLYAGCVRVSDQQGKR